eukprot:TRINITY_DN957_c1_g1_i1.p1 TRINITY_DN957_c1_g1~~TRINITY_DN957_c1_g1_i1.p1  ORF type:complete len:880 (-),score=143.58 TRINITY_DN957_c1_g1_i1:1014-3653(-)
MGMKLQGGAMADSLRNLSVVAIIPRNWRLLTVASAATVGLACGIGKPALAELWKHSKSESKASQSLPAENGFSATIRKLMAESRRAAEQGDQAKAVQLAERAAKISEAAAQVVGPAGECSPEETAKFLAATRAGRANTSRIVTQNTPRSNPSPVASPTPQVAKTLPPQQRQPSVSRSPATVPPTAPTVTATQPSRKSQSTVAKSKSPATAPRVAGLFGDIASRSGGTEVAESKPGQGSQSHAHDTTAVEQAKFSDSSEGLLAQSRLAAADGNLDYAIQLADQAIAMASSPASLFGGGAKSGSASEAIRWRENLLLRQHGELNSIASRKAAAAPSASGSATALYATADAAAPDKQVAITNTDWQSDSLPSRNPSTAVSPWTEELPPAPAPQAKRVDEPLQFRRTAITRQGEWVDAGSSSSGEADSLRASTDAAPIEPFETKSVEASPIEVTVSNEVSQPMAEFVIDASAVQAEPEEKTEVASSEGVPIAMVDERVVPIPTEAPPEVAGSDRPRLRLRSGIQQIATEFPEDSSPAKQRSEFKAAGPHSNSDSAPTADIPEKATAPRIGHVPAVDVVASSEDDTGDDSPVQRFPVQRVLQLRQRLESATALNPGASKLDSALPPAEKVPSKTSPTSVPMKAAEWEDSTSEIDPSEQVQKVSAEISPTKRPPLKMRAKLPVVMDSDIEAAANGSKVTAKSEPIDQTAAVGHSSMTHWVTAGQTTSGKVDSSKANKGEFQAGSISKPKAIVSAAAQPSLELPVAQVGYEASSAPSGIDLASIGSKVDAKPAASPRMDIAPPPPADPTAAQETARQDWYEDGLVRRRAVSSATVRHSSFGLIDRLAVALNAPASTVVSLIGGVGILLIGFGLIAVRSALRKRHSA